MKSNYIASLLGAASTVLAHGLVTELTIDGAKYAGYVVLFLPKEKLNIS